MDRFFYSCSRVLGRISAGELAALADFGPGGARQQDEQGKCDEAPKCLQSSHLDSLHCLRFAVADALPGGDEGAGGGGLG